MMLYTNWRRLSTVRRLSEHVTILCWYFFLTFPEHMHKKKKKKKKSPTAGLEMCRGKYTVGLIMEPPSSRPLTPQSAGCLHYLPSVWHDAETSDKKAPPQMNHFRLFSLTRSLCLLCNRSLNCMFGEHTAVYLPASSYYSLFVHSALFSASFSPKRLYLTSWGQNTVLWVLSGNNVN